MPVICPRCATTKLTADTTNTLNHGKQDKPQNPYLPRAQHSVDALLREQLGVRAELDDALVDDGDRVGVLDRGEPVGDGHRRPRLVLVQLVEGGLNDLSFFERDSVSMTVPGSKSTVRGNIVNAEEGVRRKETPQTY